MPETTIERLGHLKRYCANAEHGTRTRYMNGCKCMLCRAANSRYETMRAAERRAGNWNGLVSAGRARAHLTRLSRNGVGRRAVSAAADVSQSTLSDIRAGRQAQIRAQTEKRILSVSKAGISDHSLMPADKTQKQIRRLLAEGFTKRRLANELGYKRALQIGRLSMITARNAARVDKLYRKYMEG